MCQQRHTMKSNFHAMHAPNSTATLDYPDISCYSIHYLQTNTMAEDNELEVIVEVINELGPRGRESAGTAAPNNDSSAVRLPVAEENVVDNDNHRSAPTNHPHDRAKNRKLTIGLVVAAAIMAATILVASSERKMEATTPSASSASVLDDCLAQMESGVYGDAADKFTTWDEVEQLIRQELQTSLDAATVSIIDGTTSSSSKKKLPLRLGALNNDAVFSSEQRKRVSVFRKG